MLTRLNASCLLYAAAVTLLSACGDDSPVADGQAAGAAADPEAPLYGLAVSVFNPDASQTYLITTSDLSARRFDVRGQGLELPGFLFPFSYQGAIFVPNEDG